MDQQIQQSRGIRKIFFLVLRKMQKDNIEADRRKHDHKWHIRLQIIVHNTERKIICLKLKIYTTTKMLALHKRKKGFRALRT